MNRSFGFQKSFGFLFSLSVLSLSQAFADDAAVLPKGRWRIRWASTYTQASSEYSPTGDVRSLGAQYSRTIDSKVLMVLNPQTAQIIQAMNALQPGSGDALQAATLETDVDSSFFTNIFVAEYGITDRLSVGIILPVVKADVSLKATSTPNSSFNAMANQPDLPSGHPLQAKMAQLKAALQQIQQGTTVSGLNATLKSSLKYSSGLESWSGSGLGDLEIGAKYNYLRTHPIKMTLKAGARLPTGRENDPDIITDAAFGDGQIDIGAYNYLDYQPTANSLFTLELGYTAQLPSSNNTRIPLSADLPLGSQVAELDQKLGDYWELGVESNYTAFRFWTASAKYRFKQKFEDSFESSSIDTSALEVDTDSILHEAKFQLEFTNLPAVRAGEQEFPFAVAAFYQQPIAGKNITDVRTSGIALKTYF